MDKELKPSEKIKSGRKAKSASKTFISKQSVEKGNDMTVIHHFSYSRLNPERLISVYELLLPPVEVDLQESKPLMNASFQNRNRQKAS